MFIRQRIDAHETTPPCLPPRYATGHHDLTLGVVRLALLLLCIGGIGRDAAATTIFWSLDPLGTNAGKVQSAALGGPIQDVATGLGNVINVDVDLAANQVYWTDDSSSGLYRANTDSSNPEQVRFISGEIAGLALDPDAQKAYFTQRAPFFGISSIDVDGTDLDLLIGSSPSQAIALDTEAGHMYYTMPSSLGLFRANLDGSDVVSIASTGANPNGIALDLENGKIYFSDSDAIERVDLDGSNPEVVVTGLSAVQAIDISGDKLYWADRIAGKIQRSNLDGSEVEDLFTGLDNPKGISVVPEPGVALLLVHGLVGIAVCRGRRRG